MLNALFILRAAVGFLVARRAFALACAGGAPYTVNADFRMHRQFKVDHHGQLFNVNATR